MSRTPLFLHIGTNKTGTSALQLLFDRRRDALEARGVLYPRTGILNQAHYEVSRALGFDHGPVGNAEALSIVRDKLRESLRAEVNAKKPRCVIVSSEIFMLPKPVEPVASFFEDFDLTVVVYLRRHDSWMESVYNQAVKTVANPPWPRGFEGWLQYHRKTNQLAFARYRTLVDRWAAVFGRDRITVRPYEAGQNQPDLMSDFLTAIGQTHVRELLDRDLPRVNQSISFDALHMLDIFQRVNAPPNVREALKRQALGLPRPSARMSGISPVIRRQIADEFQQDYEYIAREYLGRADGRMFFDPLPDPAEPWEKPRAPTIVKVVEAAIAAAKQ